MQPSTIEKALHQWPPWFDSINRAWAKFHFSPLSTGEGLKNWQWQHDGKVWGFGEKEMDRLGLPHSGVYYWLACFYADFKNQDNSIDYDCIRDVLFTPRGEFGEKAYPLLYEYSVTVAAATRQELLRIKIEPDPEAVKPLPKDLERLIKSAKGRPPKWNYLIDAIKLGELQFEQLLENISNDGDIQADFSAICHNCGTNIRAFESQRRKLLNRVWLNAHRVWRKAGMLKPEIDRGVWSQNLFLFRR